MNTKKNGKRFAWRDDVDKMGKSLKKMRSRKPAQEGTPRPPDSREERS
jgi:hypothetical protein